VIKRRSQLEFESGQPGDTLDFQRMHSSESTRFQNIMRQAAGIDPRSLAAFRVGLSLALLWDALTSLTSVSAFYSNEGFLPLGLLAKFQTSPWMGSLHTWSGACEWQIVLLIINVIAALCLLAGYRSQISIIVCWVLLCSIQTRNPTILHSGDVILRLLCFWAMFLPLGARWSVDQWRGGTSTTTGNECVVSPASLAILIQLGLVYWMGALVKNGDEWLRDGTAVYNALSLDQFVTPTGRLLLAYPELCRVLTFGTWWLEMIGPFLIFVPIRNDLFRLITVISFWSLHIGLWISLRLGPFPLIMMTAWLLCVPTSVWDRLAGKRKHSPSSSTPSPTPEPLWMRRFITRAFVSFCLIYVVLWNFRAVDSQRWGRWFPQWMNPFGYILQLHQYWTMFAPRPTTDDGWLVMEAWLNDGTKVDLLRDGSPVTFAKPPVISAEFKDSKWQKIILNLWRSPYQEMRAPFGNYLAFQWNGSHSAPKQIKGWTLWYMREDTLPDFSPTEPQKIELLRVGSTARSLCLIPCANFSAWRQSPSPAHGETADWQ